VRSIQRFGLLYAALAILAAARGRWGPKIDAIAVVAVLVLCAIAGYAVWRRDRAVRQAVAALPLEEQIAAIQSDPSVRDVAAGDVFGNERRDWNWQLTRTLGPWLAIFYLPVLYSILAGDRLDGRIVMALAVLGILAWRYWIKGYVRRYRCPTCRAQHLPVVSIRPVRFVCVTCATTWRL
jgi:hypothetical protein